MSGDHDKVEAERLHPKAAYSRCRPNAAGQSIEMQAAKLTSLAADNYLERLDSGVQLNFISLIETGQNQPTITTIAKLARALGMKASELVAEAERLARQK